MEFSKKIAVAAFSLLGATFVFCLWEWSIHREYPAEILRIAAAVVGSDLVALKIKSGWENGKLNSGPNYDLNYKKGGSGW